VNLGRGAAAFVIDAKSILQETAFGEKSVMNRRHSVTNRKWRDKSCVFPREKVKLHLSRKSEMANEETIYRITRAVYGRLGAGADERLVEQRVMDVYRAVEPDLGASGGGASQPKGAAQRLIVSVFGLDHPGIVAGVTQILADAGCSVADINQTVVQGKFAMVIVADATSAKESVTALKERFKQAGERLGVKIYAQREDLFHAMHRI
jgi:ACT domain-containing protein